MFWPLFLILTCSLIAGPILPRQSVNLKVEFDKAMQLLSSGDPKSAEASLQKVLSVDARYVPALVAMAGIRAREGQSAAAQALFQQALTIDPKGAALQRSYARFLISQGKLEFATQALSKAARLDRSTTVQLEFGEALLLQRKAVLALGVFKAASIKDPNSALVQRGIGTSLALLGKHADAEAAFLQAYALAPKDPGILFPLAMYYKERVNLPKAEDYFLKTISADPKHQAALIALGDIHAARNERDKALSVYARATNIGPSVPIYLRIGMLQQQAGKIAEAELAYRKSMELDASAVLAHNNLAFLLLSQNRQLSEAETLARKAVAATPENPGFHDTLAMILKARGNVEAAIAELEIATRLKPENPESMYRLAILYFDKGKLPQARIMLSRALGVSKTFPGADDAQRRLTAMAR